MSSRKVVAASFVIAFAFGFTIACGGYKGGPADAGSNKKKIPINVDCSKPAWVNSAELLSMPCEAKGSHSGMEPGALQPLRKAYWNS